MRTSIKKGVLIFFQFNFPETILAFQPKKSKPISLLLYWNNLCCALNPYKFQSLSPINLTHYESDVYS